MPSCGRRGRGHRLCVTPFGTRIRAYRGSGVAGIFQTMSKPNAGSRAGRSRRVREEPASVLRRLRQLKTLTCQS